jgi:1-acyl-sn-glycerol-3-phosphate acyltransferase
VTSRSTPCVLRLVRVALVLLQVGLGVVLAGAVLPRLNRPARSRLIAAWSACLLSVLGVRLTVGGVVPRDGTRGVLLVANHVSWLDILAINAVQHRHFVAKAEVRRWPVWGWMAARTGTLFIRREKRKDLLRVLHEAGQVLAQGRCLALFPEGTTTDGGTLKPFRSGLLEAAVRADAVIWPLAIRYPRDDGSPNPSVAFVGDSSLIESLRLVLRERSIRADLTFASPLSAQ